MKSISEALDNFFTERGLSKDLQIAKLWIHWSEVVGSELAKLARPLGRTSNKQSLLLGVEDNMVMQELVYYSPQLLEQIDQFLGWQPFDNVVFKLIDNISSLDEVQIWNSYQTPILYRSSERVGKYLEEFPEGSSISKSYQAYVEAFNSSENNKLV